MNTIREIQRINDQELERGIAGTNASWHSQYAKSAWVFVGNLEHELTEGDLICVMSQYGEIEDLHLIREDDTGKSRGFAFCKYEGESIQAATPCVTIILSHLPTLHNLDC
jgi:RNA recognition motif-containing protein